MAKQRIRNFITLICFPLFSFTTAAPVADGTALENPAMFARSYSANTGSGQVRDPYSDNFDAMYNSMDLANQPARQKVAISLPNPPGPPRAPRPRPSPNFSQYENDPNRGPQMPLPPRPPNSFGSMDITVNFPKYTPNVDDSFYDSDAGAQPMTYMGGGTVGKGNSYETGDTDNYGGAGGIDKYARDLENSMFK